MRTIHNWALSRESNEQQHQVVIDNGPTLTISAGHSDNVDVFVDNGEYVILSTNNGLGYCGVEIFDNAGERVADIFAQDDCVMADLLGPRGLDLAPITIAKRLAGDLSEHI